LHNDLIIYFHEHASASIPESRLAVAVPSAGARDDVRQAKLPAGETDIDELIFRELELSRHRLPGRAAKAQPFLLGFCPGCGTTKNCRYGERGKTHPVSESHRSENTIYASNFILSYPKLPEMSIALYRETPDF
jgi:hypothetical protein